MPALAAFVLRHKALVALVWLVVAVAGAATVGGTTHRMTNNFSTPGQAFRVNNQIVQVYGNGGSQTPYVPVITVAPGQRVTDPTVAAETGRVFAAIRHMGGSVRISDFYTTHNRAFVTRDGRTTFALVFTAPQNGFGGSNTGAAIQRAVASALPKGWHAGLTGEQLLQNGTTASKGTGVMTEAMIGSVGALVILALVFGSFLALLPLLIGGVSVLGTFLIVGGLTEITGISQIVEFLIALIGLGVAIDYSLLVVSRWREERAPGMSNEAAVAEAMRHAGRAVVFAAGLGARGGHAAAGDPGVGRAAARLAEAAHRAPRVGRVLLLGRVRVPAPVGLRPGRARDHGPADGACAVAAPGRAGQFRAGGGRARARRARLADFGRHPVRRDHARRGAHLRRVGVLGGGFGGAPSRCVRGDRSDDRGLRARRNGDRLCAANVRVHCSRVLLAAKAVVFNLISLAAAYGVLTWVFQDGHGSSALFGVPATGAITMWVPLMVFAFLFGLSMDYEVFILTRIREAYDRAGSARDAVAEGLGRTGRLVTSAAAILLLSFVSMSTSPVTDLKILATGLGAGILTDAVVVRCLLVPAMVALFGRANWWLPEPLRRLLRLPAAQPARPGRPATEPGPELAAAR